MSRATTPENRPLPPAEQRVINEFFARHLREGSSGRWIDGLCDFFVEPDAGFPHFMAYLMADKLRYRSQGDHA